LILRAATSAGLRQQTMGCCEKDFKRVVRYRRPPPEYLTQLPKPPDAMHAQHPSMFEVAFADGCLPVQCQADWQKPQQLGFSHRCRGGGAVAPAGNVLACADGSLQQITPMGDMLPVGMNTMPSSSTISWRTSWAPRGGLAESAHRNSRLLHLEAGEQQQNLVSFLPKPTSAEPEASLPPAASAEAAAAGSLASSSDTNVDTELLAAAGGAGMGAVSLPGLLCERKQGEQARAMAAAQAKAAAKAAAAVTAAAAEGEESPADANPVATAPSEADVPKRGRRKKGKKKQVVKRKAPAAGSAAAPKARAQMCVPTGPGQAFGIGPPQAALRGGAQNWPTLRTFLVCFNQKTQQ
jgi:hypothetical protein